MASGQVCLLLHPSQDSAARGTGLVPVGSESSLLKNMQCGQKPSPELLGSDRREFEARKQSVKRAEPQFPHP